MADNRKLNKAVNIFCQDVNLSNTFKYNEFSRNIEYAAPPCWDETILKNDNFSDEDLIHIRFYLSNVHHFEPSKDIIADACLIMAKRRRYHPIKNFIEKEKWDQTPRLDEWLIKSMDCDDNIYIRQASSKFLIAAVNRVYHPGCKFDHMLILEGPQGIYKSTLVETLADEWFLDTNFEHRDKDLIDSMRNALIIEISELSGMSKKDIDWMKSFLTRKVDRVRLPYARRSEDFKRNNVFVGTYNPSGNNMYLRDDTGNRRFWPVECRRNADIAYIREFRHQLWAEAFHRYKQKEQYYINDKDALEILRNIHGDRELESPTFYKIRDWLTGKNKVTMNEIINDGLKISIDGKSPRELLHISSPVGQIMRKLGWVKGTNEKRHIYTSPDYKTVEQNIFDWEE